MTQYELLRISESICKALAGNNIDPADVNHLDLYEDFVRMKAEGHKFTYIQFYLAEKYNVSETSVWRIAKRMSSELR